MSKTAHILAVRSTHLPSYLKATGFHRLAHEDALRVLEEAGTFVGPRPILEDDERFRQIIPYIVLRQGPDFIGYIRGASGNEARLHGKIAIGLGGHIDLPDCTITDSGNIDLMATLDQAASRELAEEVCCMDLGSMVTLPSPKWVGLLLDNSDAVGRVHIGVVGVIDAEGEVFALEESQEGIERFSADELKANRDRLESWTAILSDHLDALL